QSAAPADCRGAVNPSLGRSGTSGRSRRRPADDANPQGQILRPWQKRFVETCVEDLGLHGCARYLIADDVGLGKTLSMAATALVLSLLDDRPVLILAPATLIWQRGHRWPAPLVRKGEGRRRGPV